MIRDRRVALDLEGVCADTHAAVYRESDVFDHDVDHPRSWDFDSGDELGEFLEVSATIWETDPLSIPPCDPDVADYVAMLRESHEVHMVTNRHGVDEQVQQWLDHHGIEVDGFKSNPPETPKAVFEKSTENPNGFDFFIDDKPGLAFEVDRLFLVDQPWNWDVEADDHQVIRVGDRGGGALRDVLNDLYAGPIRQ